MNDEQRIRFEAEGFLTVRGALDAAQLAGVREAAAAAEARWRADTGLPGTRSRTLDQVQAPIEYDDRLLALLWHPVVFPLVRAALGDDVSMIDNDLFLTPPHTPRTHAGWHHDVGMDGVFHPFSVLMVKAFYLLTDVDENAGGTALIPGSHRFAPGFAFPAVDDPREMPGAVQMTGKAGDAYLFNGRIYHAAVNNNSDHWRRVLIVNYGHFWMKIWQGYEPSARLLAAAEASNDPIHKQLMGIGDAYGQRLG
jgi:hypothetical protein